LLYPSLTTRVFSAFRCVEVEGVGSRLEGDFSIGCTNDTTGKYGTITTIAIIGMLVYTIGFPLWIVYDLWRHRKSLHDPKHDDYVLTRLRLGSLYEQYEPFYWFWEPIIILYKMLLVGALSVIEQHSPVQLFVGFLICSGYLLIVLRSAPYEDESLDKLSFFTSLSLAATLLLCLLKGMDEHRAERHEVNYDEKPWEIDNDAFSTVLVCLNIMPFIYAVGSSLLRWFQHRKEIARSAKVMARSMTRRSMVARETKETREWK